MSKRVISFIHEPFSFSSWHGSIEIESQIGPRKGTNLYLTEKKVSHMKVTLGLYICDLNKSIIFPNRDFQ